MDKERFAKAQQRKNKTIVELDELPTSVHMTTYAVDKAFAVNKLVRELYNKSYEWYGYLLATEKEPELAVDVGLPKNAMNHLGGTGLDPREIEIYRRSLPQDYFINGWIHSHGDLGFRQFSGTDDRNQPVMLNYVCSKRMTPIRKEALALDHLYIETKEHIGKEEELLSLHMPGVELEGVARARAKLYELILGGFSYAVVIGDEGWTNQEVYHKERKMVTGKNNYKKIEDAQLNTVNQGREFTLLDLARLQEKVRETIDPTKQRQQNTDSILNLGTILDDAKELLLYSKNRKK